MSQQPNDRETYDWSRFTVHSYYRASRERVFAAWSTTAGLESFFIARARHTTADGAKRAPDAHAQPGDRYAWRFVHGIDLEGEFLPVGASEAPGDSVAFSFGPMHVHVHVREVDGQVEVRLEQSGCGSDDEARAWQHLNCRSCWIYFMTNLKSVLEHDTDLRDHEAPQLNDAVSIGWRRDD